MTAIRSAGALAVALVMAAPALAQSAPSSTVETLRLTPDEKADIAAHQTEATVDAARAGLGGAGTGGRQIHGEVGAMIGTGGARDFYGTAAIPLGDHAGAVVSVESSRYGPRH
jgi:hypothetical protein